MALLMVKIFCRYHPSVGQKGRFFCTSDRPWTSFSCPWICPRTPRKLPRSCREFCKCLSRWRPRHAKWPVQAGLQRSDRYGKAVHSHTLHQSPTETRCLKLHLEQVKATLGTLPKTLIRLRRRRELRLVGSAMTSNAGTWNSWSRLVKFSAMRIIVQNKTEFEYEFTSYTSYNFARYFAVRTIWLVKEFSLSYHAAIFTSVSEPNSVTFVCVASNNPP